MSENTYSDNWPPSEEEIKTIASSALNKSENKLVKVLVYWDNPKLMILDPFHFADTQYINRAYECKGRTVEVVIGKED
tara:strand:+ start:1533 stop:1766 length:234 start_codon:yes stop_codon:yes gene_type:complete